MRRFRPFLHVLVAHALVVCAASAPASNHLDTPSVIANPSADIGDLYAWITPDGRRLALVMTIVGRKFDDRLRYVFHVDRGERFPETTSTTTIACAFPSPVVADCGIAGGDRAAGDATDPAGLVGRGGHLRVFAGLRDDPFFNNVRGTRDAYQRAIGAIKAGAAMDGAGCPQFDADTAADILDRWRHTDGGPAKNFLAGWTSSAIVITVDLAAVRGGGPLLAVRGLDRL